MKNRILTIAVMTCLALPLSVTAQQQSMGNMPCPMMDNMGEMMGDMNSMMQMMSDPAMKERMQKMHDGMGAMMKQMSDMHNNSGGGMMCGDMKEQASEDKPAVVSPEDHEAHHPDKQ